MNSKIKLLAEQAGIQEDLVDHLKDEVEVLTYIARPQDIERFFESIVRECANRASWAQDTGAEDIGGEVLKHFGVRE
jgi:hypothetical protein